MKKFGLQLPCRWVWYFLIFAFSLYRNFKRLLSKILQWILRVLSNWYHVTNIFDLLICDNETMALLLNFFEICTEMHFVSLFFSKWKKHYNLLLVVRLKCTVVHYANLNSSSKNKAFLNYGSLNMLFRFFRFPIYVYFNETFVKKLMKQLSSFNTNFQNSFIDVVYCRTLRCQTLWY